jgi:glycosyltransferase involved in cell wall biosynthesis
MADHRDTFSPPRPLLLIATDEIGGPGKGLLQFAGQLARHREDYLLCNFDLRNRPVGQFVEEARRNRLKLHLLTQRLPIDPTLVIQAWRAVRSHRLNLVQTHGYKANLIGIALRSIWRLPWIAFAHGFTDDNWRIRIYNRLDLAVFRHADRVVTVSRALQEMLVRRGIPPTRIRLIYNAVDTGPGEVTGNVNALKQSHGISQNRLVVGVVGRLNPEKGQFIFLKALRRVLEQCPDIAVLMVGEGRDRSELERYCSAHGLTDQVVFTGYRENMTEYYRAMDLLVLPSLSEGLPNTLLEAMAHGVPVLATRVGGVPEIIDRDNGVLVPPGDPERLADGMIDLLRDPVRRNELGQRGRASLFPKFSPEHRAAQIRSVYDEVLTGLRVPPPR